MSIDEAETATTTAQVAASAAETSQSSLSPPSAAASSSANPLLACKAVRKLKSALSTVYLSFGGRQLRAAAIRTAARSRIKLTEDDWQMAPAAHGNDAASPATAARRQQHSGAAQQQPAHAGRVTGRKRKRAATTARNRPTGVVNEAHRSAAPIIRHSNRQRKQPLARDVFHPPATATLDTAAGSAATATATATTSSRRSSDTAGLGGAAQRLLAGRSFKVNKQQAEAAENKRTASAEADSNRMTDEADTKQTAQHAAAINGRSAFGSAHSAAAMPAQPTPAVSSTTTQSASANARLAYSPRAPSALRECPVLRPTVAEWSDPITFIKRSDSHTTLRQWWLCCCCCPASCTLC